MPLHRRILLPVHSDVPSPPSSPLLASHRQLPTNVIIAAASAVAAFIFLSLIYYSILRRRRRPLPSSTSSFAGSLNSSTSPADHPFWHMKTVGLDDLTIDSLPSYGHRGAANADCHVCLDEITDGEVVRLLPTCGHVFHVHCIDTWLRSHLTCPLCRATVVTLEPAGGNADDSSALSEGGGDDEEDEATVEEGQSSAVTVRSVSMDSAVRGGFVFRGEGEEKEGNCSNFSNLSKEEVSEKGQSMSGKNLWLPRMGRARSSSVLPL